MASGPASLTWEQHRFAVADSYDERNNRFIGLVAGSTATNVVGTSVIVKPDLVAAQVARDALTTGAATLGTLGSAVCPTSEGAVVIPPTDDRLWRFYGTTRLDPEHYQGDLPKVAQEVIANLAAHYGTDVEITVEVRASNEDGFPETRIRTVNENARTLKLEQYGFEKDYETPAES